MVFAIGKQFFDNSARLFSYRNLKEPLGYTLAAIIGLGALAYLARRLCERRNGIFGSHGYTLQNNFSPQVLAEEKNKARIVSEISNGGDAVCFFHAQKLKFATRATREGKAIHPLTQSLLDRLERESLEKLSQQIQNYQDSEQRLREMNRVTSR